MYKRQVLGNTIALTLLKAAAFPDAHADQGEQEFTYAFHCWNTDFGRSDVVKAAHELNVPVLCSEEMCIRDRVFHTAHVCRR